MGRRKTVAQEAAALDATLAEQPLSGSPVIVVIGPRGGAGKTTASAALLNLLGQEFRVAGMLLGVDANPDSGDLLGALGLPASRVPGRLVDFIERPERVVHPSDWEPLLDVVGRVHLLHNDGVPAARLDQLAVPMVRTGLEHARRFAAVTVVDTGTSAVHPLTVGSLWHAAHLVVACRADQRSLRATARTLSDLVESGLGGLVARATLLIRLVEPSPRAQQWRADAEFFTGRVGRVVEVPYDRAAVAGQTMQWAQLQPGFWRAMYQALAAIVADIQPAPLAAAAGMGGLDPAAWPAGFDPAAANNGAMTPPFGALRVVEGVSGQHSADPRRELVMVGAAEPTAVRELPDWAKLS